MKKEQSFNTSSMTQNKKEKKNLNLSEIDKNKAENTTKNTQFKAK